MQPTRYRLVKIDGLSVFYREAGPKDAPTILLEFSGGWALVVGFLSVLAAFGLFASVSGHWLSMR